MSKLAPPSNLPARFLEALRGEDPLVIQESAPARAKKLVKGLSEKELGRKPGPERWSIREVLAHLVDHEIVYGFRLRCIAALDQPLLAGYDQQLFLDRLGTAGRMTKELLADWAAVRAVNHALVERLPSEAFERIGVHAERGKESLRAIVTRNAGHDAIHLAQIERTRDAVRAKQKKPRQEKGVAQARKRAKK